MKHLKLDEFVAKYCERQEQTPEGLIQILRLQKLNYDPVGWMMLECVQLDSSRLGSLVLLPYGPKNSFKEPPTHPISPRGLSSDMSTVCALLDAREVV